MREQRFGTLPGVRKIVLFVRSRVRWLLSAIGLESG
jgi:hypothetical protein